MTINATIALFEKHRTKKKFREKEFSIENIYYNKYGQLTHRGDPEHHLHGDEKDD